MWRELSLEVTAVPWVTEATAGPHLAQPLVELSAGEETRSKLKTRIQQHVAISSCDMESKPEIRQKKRFDSIQHGGIRPV